MSERKRAGEWVQTYSGRQWWPHDPEPDDVHHEDFPAIAQITRFGGSCRIAETEAVTFPRYVIAQHMCLVHDCVRNLCRIGMAPSAVLVATKCALVHDLHEIYPPGDQLSPFMREWDGMRETERLGLSWLSEIARRAAWCVRLKLGLPCDLPQLVKYADLVLLATERRDLMHPAPALREHWQNLPEPLATHIDVWPAERAWVEWQERFFKLFGFVPGK